MHPEPLLDGVYGAIADPTRRAIVRALAGADVTVGSLAARFPMSLNGVSKHIKVLERAGLVERTIVGREHRLHLRPAPLREAAHWLEYYRTFWNARLDALEEELIVAERGGPERPGRRRAVGAMRGRRGARVRR